MKNMLNNVQHETDGRDVEIVWISYKENIRDIGIFNKRISLTFENTYDEFEKLDLLFEVLEKKEYLTMEENESYKEVRIQINNLKNKFLKADYDREQKRLIEEKCQKDYDYLEGYFDMILQVDYKNIIGLKGTIEDLI